MSRRWGSENHSRVQGGRLRSAHTELFYLAFIPSFDAFRPTADFIQQYAFFSPASGRDFEFIYRNCRTLGVGSIWRKQQFSEVANAGRHFSPLVCFFWQEIEGSILSLLRYCVIRCHHCFTLLSMAFKILLEWWSYDVDLFLSLTFNAIALFSNSLCHYVCEVWK